MSEELLINYTPMESRMAVLTDGVTSEILIERHQKLGMVGNIYLGTVARVLPGMQAAYVDIGQARTAFLHEKKKEHTKMEKVTKKKPGLLAQVNQIVTELNLNLLNA